MSKKVATGRGTKIEKVQKLLLRIKIVQLIWKSVVLYILSLNIDIFKIFIFILPSKRHEKDQNRFYYKKPVNSYLSRIKSF